MMARLRDWWTGLSRRERIATVLAAALVVTATTFLVAIEPAWRARGRLAAELPRLRAQMAEVDALALEAKKLGARAAPAESPAQAKTALAKLAAEKNLASATVQEGENQRLLVAVRKADAASTLALLRDASTQLPLRISTARISRTAPGVVDADATLIPAGAR